jgi:hypothetical protein
MIYNFLDTFSVMFNGVTQPIHQYHGVCREGGVVTEEYIYSTVESEDQEAISNGVFMTFDWVESKKNEYRVFYHVRSTRVSMRIGVYNQGTKEFTFSDTIAIRSDMLYLPNIKVTTKIYQAEIVSTLLAAFPFLNDLFMDQIINKVKTHSKNGYIPTTS